MTMQKENVSGQTTTERPVWTIEISFYEGEVDPHSLYEGVETFVMKACPGFSGVVSIVKEVPNAD